MGARVPPRPLRQLHVVVTRRVPWDAAIASGAAMPAEAQVVIAVA